MSPLFRKNPLKKQVKSEKRDNLRKTLKDYKEVFPLMDLYGSNKPPAMSFIDIRNLSREKRQSKIIYSKLSKIYKDKKYASNLREFIELYHYGRYLKKSEMEFFRLQLLNSYRETLSKNKERAGPEFLNKYITDILQLSFEKADKYIKKSKSINK